MLELGGKRYMKGKRGVEKDLEQAEKYMRMAGENDEPEGLYKLFRVYDSEGNKEKAFEALKESAEKGYTRATMEIVVFYRSVPITRPRLQRSTVMLHGREVLF